MIKMILEEKVAIITGAGSGFGRATAELFAKEGAKIVVVDFNEGGANETVEAIQAHGGEAIAVIADVSDQAAVKNFIQKALDAFGRIDILFNNAGVYAPGNVEATDEDAWQKSLDVNMSGVYYACKYAMPHLIESKGNIINTASAGGLIGFPDAFAYAATKGAVISMTRAIATDYADIPVRANAIAPGTGRTGMTNELLEDEDIASGFLNPIPMERFGEPEDVAHAALYLASDGASYITGHTLPVDGGWTMS